MAQWRALRGWTQAEIASRLASLDELERSFEPGVIEHEEGWRPERSQAVIAREAPGPPQPAAAFERACAGVVGYRFSDPSIVTAYFDRRAPLLGRRMLLELRVLGLRFLNGVIVAQVIEEQSDRASSFGFRYDTLDGHLERGWEWFVLRKDHDSGEVRFSIRSRWRSGQFPNWWSRAGFALLSGHYRALWLRRAHQRLASIARSASHPIARSNTPRETAMRDTSAIDRSSSRTSMHAAAIGAITGMRSMTGTALLGVANLVDPPASKSAVLRASSSPITASLLSAMAAGEMVADKHPRMPARTTAPAWGARVVLGALAGAGVAARRERSTLAGAVAGAIGAAVATKLAYGARSRLAERYRAGSVVPGLIEDGLVLAASAVLLRALVR